MEIGRKLLLNDSFLSFVLLMCLQNCNNHSQKRDLQKKKIKLQKMADFLIVVLGVLVSLLLLVVKKVIFPRKYCVDANGKPIPGPPANFFLGNVPLFAKIKVFILFFFLVQTQQSNLNSLSFVTLPQCRKTKNLLSWSNVCFKNTEILLEYNSFEVQMCY